MGRAIDTEKSIDELKIKVEKLENIVLGMGTSLDKIEESVFGKEKEKSKNGKKKTNNKRNTKGSKQSDNGKTDVNSKASKS